MLIYIVLNFLIINVALQIHVKVANFIINKILSSRSISNFIYNRKFKNAYKILQKTEIFEKAYITKNTWQFL